MSSEDYSIFLGAFNVMAGYGKDEIFEVKNKLSFLTIELLYNNKNYENQLKL